MFYRSPTICAVLFMWFLSANLLCASAAMKKVLLHPASVTPSSSGSSTVIVNDSHFEERGMKSNQDLNCPS